MNTLEFAEQVANETLKDTRQAYDALHERIHKFMTLLAGGAGGVGIFALGKLGPASAASQIAPLGALCIWWFAIVGVVMLQGAKSRPLKAGTDSAAIRTRFLKHTVNIPSAPTDDALWYTRWEHLAAVDSQIESYASGTSARAHTLDKAYVCVACSPAVAALAYLFTL